MGACTPSLSRNCMPPRTTRKSHRRTVSDRTMVGTAQPLCLSASETEGRRYEMTMNLGKSEITAPHNNAGLDDEIASSRRGSVFLDIPFYRTGLPETGFSAARCPMHICKVLLQFGPFWSCAVSACYRSDNFRHLWSSTSKCNFLVLPFLSGI